MSTGPRLDGFAANEHQSVTMPGTGNRQTDQERADAAEEESVRPLLARANLLRMRRQWEDAITACTDALRRAPRSANAHALLGNIYESQGKFEDAIEWYVMASELSPLSAADAAQLQHLLETQRAKLRTDELSNTVPIDQKPIGEKTLEWFDRIFPPGRTDGITRLILAISASIAVIIALCAALIYFFVSPKREEAQADAAQTLAADTVVSASPIVMTPSHPKSPVYSGPDIASPSPGASSSPTETSARTSIGADGAVSDIRAKVAQALEGGGASISALTAAAGSGDVAIDLTLPNVKAETPDHLRERALRVSAIAARAAALSAPESVLKAMLRLGLDASYLPLAASPSPGIPASHTGPAVIFVATVSLRSFRDSNVAGLPTSDLLARFESAQWYGGLAPTAASPAPGVPAATGTPLAGGQPPTQPAVGTTGATPAPPAAPSSGPPASTPAPSATP